MECPQKTADMLITTARRAQIPTRTGKATQ
jgi:hypothetical protein